jgi:hypothetical protein
MQSKAPKAKAPAPMAIANSIAVIADDESLVTGD